MTCITVPHRHACDPSDPVCVPIHTLGVLLPQPSAWPDCLLHGHHVSVHAVTVSSSSSAVHQVAELRSRVHLLSFAIVQAPGSHMAYLGNLMHYRDSASRSCFSIMYSVNHHRCISRSHHSSRLWWYRQNTQFHRPAAPLTQFDPLHDAFRA